MAYSNILVGAGPRPTQPVIRKISVADLRDALAKAMDDFYAMPTHAMFLCIIYPIIYPIVGFVLARLMFGYFCLCSFRWRAGSPWLGRSRRSASTS